VLRLFADARRDLDRQISGAAARYRLDSRHSEFNAKAPRRKDATKTI